MIKEVYRDYATAAICAWSGAGCPNPAESMRLYDGAVLADMVACYTAFRLVGLTMPDACDAALYVYTPGRIRRGELTSRVTRFAVDHYLSERQVWERLAKVRREFARQRGLRI